MKRILISGGGGKFAQSVLKQRGENIVFAPPRSRMDITQLEDIEAAIEIYKPDIFLHAAAYTRPMSKHRKNPDLSIQNNIIGTCNVVLACIKHDIKLIYMSTDYVYPGTTGDYKEEDPLLPINDYAWTKLGGECAVRLYKNSLVLRACMTERPFVHDKALVDSKKSLMYIDEAAEICLKLLDETGIINMGGEPTNSYEFIKHERPNIEKIYRKDILDVNMAEDSTMNLDKMKESLHEKNTL